MAAKRLVFIVLSGAFSLAALGGCAWMSEEQRYYLNKDFNRLKAFNWGRAAEDISGIDELWPRPSTLERQAEARTCLHPNSENRVIIQQDVSDKVEYRRCVLAPYPVGAAAPGQRMVNRPEPQS